ncbi:MAG: cytochrome c [Actinobacteria bacterium]|nr:cytochrome c [Actinomycetota bacterium]
MQTTLFILAWAVAFFGVLAFAFYGTRGNAEPAGGKAAKALGSVPGGVRVLIGLTAALALVLIPVLVTASASDRVPSGAGTYTLDSSESKREGREIFRQTCASCHTLSAANARGVYGPNLDTMGLNADGSAQRIEAAIENGGVSGKQMPKLLLEGEDAKLVSEYVAAVAGK